MIVTALEPDPRGSGGVRVQVDGGPFATVAARDVAALGLKGGLHLDEAAAAAVEQRAEAFSARTVALRMLGYRALPSREIVHRLTRKGHARAVAEAAVMELVSEGLVNDAEFARHFVRTRAARRRYGPTRLLAELRRLGVDDGVAESAVAETLAQEQIDPALLLRQAAERKLQALAGVAPDIRRRRLKAYLLRRGFSPGDIREFLERWRD